MPIEEMLVARVRSYFLLSMIYTITRRTLQVNLMAEENTTYTPEFYTKFGPSVCGTFAVGIEYGLRN
jgi:hypothetical protein